jgi:hypothetical protein
MTDLVRVSLPPAITDAMNAVADRSLAVDDRAAVYAVLHRIQLLINRALRPAKDELIAHLEAHGGELGPLSLKSTAVDVVYECNLEDNWGDVTIQDAMGMLKRIAPDYIRHVPEHYEIRTAELGRGIAAGDPVARELHAEMNRRGWRTTGGRRTSLAVREAPTGKKAAA